MFSQFNRNSVADNTNEEEITPEYKGMKHRDIPKYEAIKEMLLAAGYFRIRISTLTPFDKVVGGLCWCISNSNVDVDVDVSFEEDSNIGEKIRISEIILTSLKFMKYPFQIQPVQIQGLDFDPLYKVIQWLVLKVFETREENKEKMRKYSVLRFETEFEDAKDEKEITSVNESYFEKLEREYFPKRKFKSKMKSKRSIKHHVQSVLLEYGQENTATFKNQQQEEEEEEEERKKKEEEERQQQELKENLTKVGKFSTQNLSKIISYGSEEISKEKEEYEKKSQKLKEENLAKGDKNEEKFRFKQISNQLKKQIENQKGEFLKLKKELDELTKEKNERKEEVEKYLNYNAKIENKIHEYEENEEDSDDIRELKKLINLNESLKQQEAEFKLNCSNQLSEFKKLLKQYELSESSEEFQKFKKIEDTNEIYFEKLKKIKKLNAKKNREISLVQRKIDNIPTRTELNQYEKRFKELYEQIVLKLEETRKYYDIYNTESEVFDYMKKEMSLLTSINEGYEKTIGKKISKEYKNWLIDTSKKSLDAVNQSKSAVEKKIEKISKKKDGAQDAYNKLVTKQRTYFSTLKEFQDECNKNEKLNKALK